MAEPSDFKKRKLELCISPHSVLIQFDQNAISLLASMPPLYLRISRGSRSADSCLASLEESMTGSMMYIANWGDSNLAFNVTLTQQICSGKFDSKEIKIQLKIDSGDKSRQKSLASCTYDISCLNFFALDFVETSSETRQISLRMGKSASAAIRSILLEATFHYKYLEEEEVSADNFQSHSTSILANELTTTTTANRIEKKNQIATTPIATSIGSERHLEVNTIQYQTETRTPGGEKVLSDIIAHANHPAASKSPLGLDTLSLTLQDASQTKGAIVSSSTTKSLIPTKKRFQWLRKNKSKSKNVSLLYSGQPSSSREKYPSAIAPTPVELDDSSALLSNMRHVNIDTQSLHSETIEITSTQLNGQGCNVVTHIVQSNNEQKNQASKNINNGKGSSENKDISITTPPLHSGTQQSPTMPKCNVSGNNVVMHAMGNSYERKNKVSQGIKSDNTEVNCPEICDQKIALEKHTKSQNISLDPSMNDRASACVVSSTATLSKSPWQQYSQEGSLKSNCNFSPNKQSKWRKSQRDHCTEQKQPNVHSVSQCTNRSSRSRSMSPTGVGARNLSKHLSDSTPLLLQPKLALNQRSLSVSQLSKQRKSSNRSLSDLIKPTTVRSCNPAQEQHTNFSSKLTNESNFGILKIRLKAVDTGQDLSALKRNTTPSTEKNNFNVAEEITECLHCVFTINGNIGRFESSMQPVFPRKTVIWDNDEEMYFYAPQLKHLFILCRKNKLVSADDIDVSLRVDSKQNKSQSRDDKCIGASVLDICSLAVKSAIPSDNIYKYLAGLKGEDIKLSLQPKGSMLLVGFYYALQPRYKVSCKGTMTIQSLSGLNCHPNDELSCTLKVDTSFQDSTNPQGVQMCINHGWKDDPINFEACCNLDCNIQIWAYSSEETEYWCGSCVVPLAMLLHDDDICRHSCGEETDGSFFFTKQVTKHITVPVEPKGKITLSFQLHLRDQSRFYTSSPASAAINICKRGSLRRTTFKRTGNFDLKVKKTYNEETFDLQQENIDFKKEVEFLREELRQTKAKLAESEFYREQTLLELRHLQELATNTQTSSKEDLQSRKKPKLHKK